eukprot:7252216-Karenia_brevis.AAC.1
MGTTQCTGPSPKKLPCGDGRLACLRRQRLTKRDHHHHHGPWAIPGPGLNLSVSSSLGPRPT